MVLYSITQNKCIMTISCGGGHRSYGCTSLSEVGGCNIEYLAVINWGDILHVNFSICFVAVSKQEGSGGVY